MSQEASTHPSCPKCRCHAGTIALAVAMVASTFIAASSWKDVRKRPEKNNIRITGSARKRIVSDLIQWAASIEARGDDRKAA